jgi:hypothetical protein
MSFFFGDSFDLYAQMSDATAGHWDGASLNPNSTSLAVGRFSNSRAWFISSSLTTLIKTSNQNDAVHHFIVAFMSTSITATNLGFYIELFDGATAQCSVVFRSDGAILLTSGGPTGTMLATYTGAFTANNVWYAFEIEVVVNSTTGSITIRKNGNPNNDFFLGSLNTRNSANNYANKIQLGEASNMNTMYVDDFLWRSDAASVPWVGDIRCYTRRPTSDVSVQFSRTSSASNAVMWTGVGVQQNFGANFATYMKFVAPYSGLLSAVTFPSSTGGTGHLKAAIFSDVSNTIGTLLATSAELTNPATGNITLTFSSPAYVIGGQSYWVGYNCDNTNIQLNVRNNPAECPAIIYISTSSYSSWPVSNPGGAIAGGNIPGVTLSFTPQSNADAVSELYTDNLSSYVYSSTNGQFDLYAIWATGVTPVSTVGVVTRGYFQKSDSGSRNATVRLKSGGTTVQGVDTALNTVWGWIARTDLVDPATSAPWAATAVNGVNIGPVVTA